MSRFDEFVDEFVFMARNAADVATKKTGEVVETSKIRYQMKQVEWEIEKAYAKLGAIVYEAKKSADSFDEVIALAVSEIDDLKTRYEELGEKLRTYKNVVRCPGCGKENDMNGAFCSRCGTPLAVETSQSDSEEL
jgi:predicted nuclease with TOPRIM domain